MPQWSHRAARQFSSIISNLHPVIDIHCVRGATTSGHGRASGTMADSFIQFILADLLCRFHIIVPKISSDRILGPWLVQLWMVALSGNGHTARNSLNGSKSRPKLLVQHPRRVNRCITSKAAIPCRWMLSYPSRPRFVLSQMVGVSGQ